MMPPPGLVLAGGQSRRMGLNKALAPLGGRPLLQRVVERLRPQVSALFLNAEGDWAGRFGLPLVADGHPGHLGPLAGIAAGLLHASRHLPQADHLLVVPADSPFFAADLGLRLQEAIAAGAEIAIASSGGRDHPVFGLWPVALAADLDDFIATETRRSLHGFLARHRTRTVDFPLIETPAGPLDPFFNINTPDDLAQAGLFLVHDIG